jgi:phospholipid-binding lipoprotein MlaA
MRIGSFRLGGAALALLLLQACASNLQRDARDPLEPVNRAIFGFNEAVDGAVLKPAATAYRDVTPRWMRNGVRNFFNNLQDAWSVVNNGLQGRGEEMGDNLGRVMLNSSFGLFGVIDIATEAGIERHTADFGLTLGRWGVSPGPYVVLPVLGPYTLREVSALPVEWSADPINQLESPLSTGLTVVKLVDVRAGFLGADSVLGGAALDKYTFTRDAYLQRQRSHQYDGNPPEEDAAP